MESLIFKVTHKMLKNYQKCCKRLEQHLRPRVQTEKTKGIQKYIPSRNTHKPFNNKNIKTQYFSLNFK